MSEESGIPEHLEIVRRANDAFNRRDGDAWLSFFSVDVVYRPVPTFTDSQARRGLDALRRFMDEWHDAWADDYITHVESIREYGDAVIVLLRFTGHARASGVEVAGAIFEVCRFRDGKIASVEDFTDRADALKAVGADG